MNFKKIAAGMLACTMSMSLFGCELVSVNTERDNSQVVITVGDKNYSKETVNGMVNSVLSMYGIDKASDKAYDEYRVSMGEGYAEQKALAYYAVQNGYADKLSEDDKKKVNEDYDKAVKHYNEELYNTAKEELGYTDEEGAPAFDDAAQKRVEKDTAKRQKEYLNSLGVSNLEEYKETLIEEKAVELYKTHLEGTVNISDDEVKSHYDSLVNEQQTSYGNSQTDYITDAGDSEKIIVYTPEGFRRVKNLLIKIDNTSSEKIKALESEIEALDDGDAKNQKQSELDAVKKEAFGKIQNKANSVQKMAKDGVNFDQLISEYGEDEGAKTNKDGYLMHEKATGQYVENFQKAGMELAKVGDISGLVETEYGYHILLYASDVKSGAAAFDTVKDKVKDEALTQKKDKVVSSKTTEIFDNYKADGTVKLYLDRLKTASVPGKN